MELVICAKRQSILDAPGPVLVTGEPGSGKTTIALAKAQIFGYLNSVMDFGSDIPFFDQIQKC